MMRHLAAELAIMPASDLYRAYDAARADAYGTYCNGAARLDCIGAEVGRRERAVLAGAR